MASHELPKSRYPKPYFRRGPYPNIFRDEQKHKLDGVVFANTDYFHKDAPKNVARQYVELSGGLTHQPQLPWNYPAVTEDEEILERVMACEFLEPIFKPEFPLTDKRSHIRFVAGRRSTYVPFMQNVITSPSVVGTQTINVHRSYTRPDHYFIKDTQQGLMMVFNNRVSSEIQVSSIIMNHGLVNLKLLTPEVKDATIRHLAKTIRNQRNLEQFSYENGLLCRTDAMRILVAVALGAGHTLRKAYLNNLFSPTLLPIETESEYLDVYNEFEYNPETVPWFTEELIAKVWKDVVERPSYDILPTTSMDKYFVMALRSFANLTVLMANYTWFSKGNGLYLLYLESIRNGNLKKLILYMTPVEHPNHSRQIICYKAWMEAVKLCPQLELHLILGQNAGEMDLNKLMVKSMPLTSFHFSSVYPLVDPSKQKPWFFSYVTRYLRSYFRSSLRMITMEVWHPGCRVDVSLTSLLLQCPMLQVFIYRGNMDKLDTIHAICDFLIKDQAMRLKRLGFYVVDDPCRPKGWKEAIESTKEKYQTPLALKGITFHLGIWKF